MAHPARLTGDLLVRKVETLAAGLAAANRHLGQSLPARHEPRLECHAPILGRLAGAAMPTGHRQASPAPARDDKVKTTVRLDPDQHGRLRIFAARARCTSQEIMTRALEAYLQSCGLDCACLRRGPGKG